MKLILTSIVIPLLFILHKNYISPATSIELASIFTNNMVLQRDTPTTIWGTADPVGEVIIKINDTKAIAEVGKDGKWKTNLSAMKAGGPYTLEVIGRDTLKLSDVFYGDVWLASGQSNMDFSLSIANDYQKALSDMDKRNIRFFRVPLSLSNRPQEDIHGGNGWTKLNKKNAGRFSAVAYFFASNLQRENVPIGIIQSAVGGTPAEYWTSSQMLQTVPGFLNMQINAPEEKPYFANAAEVAEKRRSIIEKASDNLQNIKTQKNSEAWKKIKVPGIWEESVLPDFDGFVWFKKTIYIPKEFDGEILKLHLGQIDDDDITWFNGTKIGETQGVTKDRTYTIPANLIKTGKNELIIRILDTGGGGGLIGPSEDMKLQSSSGENITSLTGNWSYNETFEPQFPNLNFKPASLYNAMIAPLIPYTIKGAIWYQGENNASQAYQYQKLFPALIEDWRVRWKEGYFPFLFVQLANFMDRKPEPADDAWAELREAQSMALRYPKTGMAVTIDIGEGDDIHPRNKHDVGKRLALAALKIAYNKDTVYSGPTYQAMKIHNNTIELIFSNIGSGLTLKNAEKLKGFAVAGKDKKFYWADARIEGDRIIVFSPEVPNPVAVRYAWAANPEATLYNKEGLPASPFRTDSWKGITE